jgi:hypothetical protein
MWCEIFLRHHYVFDIVGLKDSDSKETAEFVYIKNIISQGYLNQIHNRIKYFIVKMSI